MEDSRTARTARLVQAVLRCYPARWRRRHGEEAAELAALLIRDGTPAGSIACSYLAGAAREWVTPGHGRRLGAAACVLLAAVCLMGVSAGLLTSTVPARAASTSQARPLPHCRPGPPQPAAGMISAARLPQAITEVAGHGRSC
jgi:hypothetical protein